MKRPPGPWGRRGYQIRAQSGMGAHVATAQISTVDAILIAAAPDLLTLLLIACEDLDSDLPPGAGEQRAVEIRAWLADLRLISIPPYGIGEIDGDPDIDRHDTKHTEET